MFILLSKINLRGSVLALKRTLIATALALVLVLALAAPALAQFDHSVSYEMDGVIDLKKTDRPLLQHRRRS